MRKLDPIVPLKAGTTDPLETIRKLREEYGIRRFVLTAPNLESVMNGYPSLDDFRMIGRSLRSLRERAEGMDVEIGWWCCPTLRSGADFLQRIVGIDGREASISCCPLCGEFRADFSAKIAAVAEIAQPELILLEDDFELSRHTGIWFGCFCPTHLEEFARRAGRYYPREELQRRFGEENAENSSLRRLFFELSHDTMVGMARAIREAVDAVSASTRIGLCQPGESFLDGNYFTDVARALAGPHTRPLLRVFGSQYSCGDSPQSVPSTLSYTFYTLEHLPEDVESVHESDTYPHTRFFMSSAYLRSLMTGAFAAGCSGTLFYGAQYLDDPCEESGYFEMFRKERMKFDAFREAVADAPLAGWQLLRDPAESNVLAATGRGWYERVWDCHGTGWFGRLGIPYTTREQPVKFLNGTTAESLPEDEVRRILSGGVLIDGEGARILARRGFGASWLGVEVEELEKLNFCEEEILPQAGVSDRPGRKIYNLAFAPAGGESSRFVRLRLCGAEALTNYLAPSGEVVQPGVTRFVNAAGGRVAVLGCATFWNNSSLQFCYRKRSLIRELYGFLSGGELLPVTETVSPNVWLLCNLARTGERMIVTVTDCSLDPMESAHLELAPKWRSAGISELAVDGSWSEVRFVRKENGVEIGGEFFTLKPRIFCFDSVKS